MRHVVEPAHGHARWADNQTADRPVVGTIKGKPSRPARDGQRCRDNTAMHNNGHSLAWVRVANALQATAHTGLQSLRCFSSGQFTPFLIGPSAQERRVIFSRAKAKLAPIPIAQKTSRRSGSTIGVNPRCAAKGAAV